ncbi:MAG: cupin domain-containing protein [Chloroflexota bacterium]|nr:cupin domain-containing protein [Chloroflexota bacterium]MDQ5865611.1 cupin domain-containing protein [Chloroflexota bacterium]
MDDRMKHNGEFMAVHAADLEAVLRQYGRQYLAGDLKRPQQLPYVKDTAIEIGITHYEGDTTERPHWHPLQREYQYVLAGSTVYVDSITGQEHTYQTGDFYAILPEICYGQHSSAGTTILFIKHPAIDDKMVCKNCLRENCPSRLEPFSTKKIVSDEVTTDDQE